jgi:flavin reductase (DIM6/NTAB) family NADH-FMN oxidoreductase RutF
VTVGATFAALMGGLDYPMLIVTADAGDGPAGCLVGFSTQCSIRPPRFYVCLSDKNRTERVASAAEVLGVHFLAAEHRQLAVAFGGETTDEEDTFARCRWHPGRFGAPILDDCGRWLVGRIVERRPLGDHVGFLLEPVAAHDEGEERPLLFSDVKGVDPGHRP